MVFGPILDVQLKLSDRPDAPKLSKFSQYPLSPCYDMYVLSLAMMHMAYFG